MVLWHPYVCQEETGVKTLGTCCPKANPQRRVIDLRAWVTIFKVNSGAALVDEAVEVVELGQQDEHHPLPLRQVLVRFR